jgi:hypothetical protein
VGHEPVLSFRYLKLLWEFWKSSTLHLRRYRIGRLRKKACYEEVVVDVVDQNQDLNDLSTAEMPSPTDPGMIVYHESLMVSSLRMGYCIRIAHVHDVDEGDHRTDFRMNCVGRYIPYLLRLRLGSMAEDSADLVYGR